VQKITDERQSHLKSSFKMKTRVGLGLLVLVLVACDSGPSGHEVAPSSSPSPLELASVDLRVHPRTSRAGAPIMYSFRNTTDHLITYRNRYALEIRDGNRWRALPTAGCLQDGLAVVEVPPGETSRSEDIVACWYRSDRRQHLLWGRYRVSKRLRLDGSRNKVFTTSAIFEIKKRRRRCELPDGSPEMSPNLFVPRACVKHVRLLPFESIEFVRPRNPDTGDYRGTVTLADSLSSCTAVTGWAIASFSPFIFLLEGGEFRKESLCAEFRPPRTVSLLMLDVPNRGSRIVDASTLPRYVDRYRPRGKRN
jgi:hypothetical protein